MRLKKVIPLRTSYSTLLTRRLSLWVILNLLRNSFLKRLMRKLRSKKSTPRITQSSGKRMRPRKKSLKSQSQRKRSQRQKRSRSLLLKNRKKLKLNSTPSRRPSTIPQRLPKTNWKSRKTTSLPNLWQSRSNRENTSNRSNKLRKMLKLLSISKPMLKSRPRESWTNSMAKSWDGC
jgi:hypothetical protein